MSRVDEMSAARMILKKKRKTEKKKKKKKRDGWACGIHRKERNGAALILYSFYTVCRDRSVYRYLHYQP